MKGSLLRTIMPQQRERGSITLAHSEGPHMQIRRKLRHEPNRSGDSENGSKMRHFTTHSHTSNLQGCSRLHVETVKGLRSSQMASSAGHRSLVVSLNLTSTIKTLLKKSEFPHVKNLKKYSWIPQSWNHVLVARRTVYPVRSRGESVLRLSLGRRPVNLFPSAQRTKTFTYLIHTSPCNFRLMFSIPLEHTSAGFPRDFPRVPVVSHGISR